MLIARVQHVPFWNDLAPLTWQHHWDDSGIALLINDGRSVGLKLQGYQCIPSLYGGPLIGTYHLDRVNFHWGPDNENGAHHLIDDTAIAMEVHAIYYNSCCNIPHMRTATEAASWAVVGVHFTEGSRNNTFRSIAQSIPYVQEPDSYITIESDYLSWLKRPRMDYGYLTYKSEIYDNTQVTWIVYEEPNTISKAQVDVFRTLLRQDRTSMTESKCKLPVNPIRGEIVLVRDTSFLPHRIT